MFLILLVLLTITNLPVYSAAATPMGSGIPLKKIICNTGKGPVTLTVPIIGLSTAQLASLDEVDKIKSLKELTNHLRRQINLFKRARRDAARDVCTAFAATSGAPEPLPLTVLQWSREEDVEETMFDIVERVVLWQRFTNLFIDGMKKSGSFAEYCSPENCRYALIGMVLSELAVSNTSAHSNEIRGALSFLFNIVLSSASKDSKYSVKSLNKLYLEWDALKDVKAQQGSMRHMSLLIEAIEEVTA